MTSESCSHVHLITGGLL